MFAWKPGLRLALVALFMLCFWTGSVLGAPRSLRFERLSIEQGLAQQSVLTILQDRRGFMWFGTQAGLNRFDGYRVTVYRNNADDPDSIPDNYVLASYEDERGRLWFGTKGGLTRFDHATGKFVRYAAPEASARVPGSPATASSYTGNRAVLAIQPAPGGGLWLATGDGLQYLDPASGRLRGYRHDPADPRTLRDNRVNALALDGRGHLWIGTAAGLDRLAPGADRFDHHDLDPEDQQRNTVLALSMGPRDTLWVGTAAGLEAWRLGDGTAFAQPRRRRIGTDEGMSEARINALYHDRGNTLWVGTDMDGLKWLDPATGRFLSYRNDPADQHSLSDNQVSSMLVDRTGTLWAGTHMGGVSRTDLASGGFTRYGGNEGLGRAKVRAIAEDPDGRVWIGTTGDGLMRLGRPGARVERHGQGELPGQVVTALAHARERLWIGTPTGLYWRDAAGRFGQTALGASPGANHVQAIHAGRGGTLWIVTRGGLAALPPGQQTVRTWRHDADDSGSLGENYGFAALEDRRGIVWIGTETGLERYDPGSGRFTHYRHDPRNPHSLRHGRIYYLMESARGELWVGTAGGLHRMEVGKEAGTEMDGERVRFRFYPFNKGPEALPIGAMIEDEHGFVWASTTAGITRVDPATGVTKNYTAKDGLVDGSYFVGAAMRSRDGQFWFGGTSGLTSFVPDAVRDNPYAPEVVITDFLVLNRSRATPNLHEQSALALSHHDTVFTLEFAALHYADPDGNRYAYRLEGFDQAWVDTDARRRYATYTNLDPGTYVFRVRASNKDGVWSAQPASLTITIEPPFWKTPWFRTLAVLALLSLCTATYRLRIRALVGQKLLLEREVGARTIELRRQKESAERRKKEVEQQKEVVEQAHRNIALLSDIGRALTANLELEAIMRTLYEHVHALMDASLFAVVLRHPERGSIEYAYAVVDGERRAAFELPEDPNRHLAAWAIVRGREVQAGELPDDLLDYLPALPPEEAFEFALPCAWRAGIAPRSLLLVPVVVGERVLGALTVQSPAARAYGPVHLDMLETLAAYVGVAIDNASAYRQLKETQAQLAAQEKLASLGSLVAGVAHELNTPIGNSLLMASTLQERTSDIAARFDSASLRRSDLADYMSASREASSLIMRSLHNAAELVNSFRQVSVDQASAQRRRFDLARACQE
ncbi:two-component regulator propeller domain-containing protein, partial [Massilia sp. BSC265]|uniref:two-component regulator propeller domain-containing protein n=1 Tax=Massilia sp. BSC265 TaxID=1549812 RepID=UPI00068C58A2